MFEMQSDILSDLYFYVFPQVRRLMKDFMEENLDPQSQKDREKHDVFLSDPLKAGIIILIVYNKYRLKEDNRSQLSHLCQLLCLPKKPRDDFLAYWTDFTQGLPEHIGYMFIVFYSVNLRILRLL